MRLKAAEMVAKFSDPRTALRALASFDATVKPEKIDLSKTFTNEFAKRAKDKFKA